MNVPLRPYLGNFGTAIEAAVCTGGQSFAFDAGPFSLSRFSVGSHESTAYSNDSHLLIYAVRSAGHVEMEIGGELDAFETDKTSLTFAPSHSKQSYSFEGQTDNIMLSLKSDFVGRLSECWDNKAEHSLDPATQLRRSRISHLMVEMQRTLKSGDIGFRVAAEALAMQVAVELFRHFSGQQKTVSQRSGVFDADLIKDYVDASLDRNICLSDMSGVLAMDVFSFSRLFKSEMGTTPARYVMQRRIERACQLLSASNLSVAEIAYACGFSSQAHLTTSFKKHVGETPARYRIEVMQ